MGALVRTLDEWMLSDECLRIKEDIKSLPLLDNGSVYNKDNCGVSDSLTETEYLEECYQSYCNRVISEYTRRSYGERV